MALDPGNYTGTYKLIGGSPSLDFANLVSYRGTGREHDWLIPRANAGRWAAAVGLPKARPAELDSLPDLRELIARIFLAVVDGLNPRPEDVAALGRSAVESASERDLRFDNGRRVAAWSAGVSSLTEELTRDAVRLLTSAERLSRVAACVECRWLFCDTSRNHSRRWCDPADCGNRSRQRRHYRYTHGTERR